MHLERVVNALLAKSHSCINWGLGILACLHLAACSSFGPQYLEESRGNYIEVIAATDREELLANLVRLRHSEAPVFMQIDSITVSPDLTFRLGGEATLDSSVVSTGRLSPSISYAEQPTIVYKPLLGREFSKELLLPIKLPPIFILLENGWSLDTVLLPLSRSINGVRNYDQQYSQSSGFPAEYRRFTRAVSALGNLQRAGKITIGTEVAGEKSDTLVMILSDEGRRSPDWTEVHKTFGLDPESSEVKLSLGLKGDSSTLALETRPLLGVMRYLSSFIEEDTLDPAIQDREVHDRLGFRVKTSNNRPSSAIVSVNHLGTWFAIDSGDTSSKEVFMMLRILFNLQAQQDSGGSGIALTLPVR